MLPRVLCRHCQSPRKYFIVSRTYFHVVLMCEGNYQVWGLLGWRKTNSKFHVNFSSYFHSHQTDWNLHGRDKCSGVCWGEKRDNNKCKQNVKEAQRLCEFKVVCCDSWTSHCRFLTISGNSVYLRDVKRCDFSICDETKVRSLQGCRASHQILFRWFQAVFDDFRLIVPEIESARLSLIAANCFWNQICAILMRNPINNFILIRRKTVSDENFLITGDNTTSY